MAASTIENGKQTVTAVVGLTPRQLDVFRLIAQGWRCEAIARELDESIGAVRYDVRAGVAWLGAENVTHAASMLAQAGTIELPPEQLPTPLLRDFLRKKLRAAHAA